MKNINDWCPSKFIFKKGRLKISKDKKKLRVTSRLAASLVADFYSENLSLHVKGKLLDLGCGKVPLYEAYREYIEDVTCVDWSNTQHKNTNLDFECDLNKRLDFAECDAFDTIILSDVLEHIRRPEELIREMYRVLKKGGKIILNVPFYYYLHEEPHDYFRYTRYALRSMFEDKGFEVVTLQSLGGGLDVLTDLVSKLIAILFPLGKYVGIFVQKLALLFAQTKIGRKLRKRTEMQFPLSYGIIVVKR